MHARLPLIPIVIAAGCFTTLAAADPVEPPSFELWKAAYEATDPDKVDASPEEKAYNDAMRVYLDDHMQRRHPELHKLVQDSQDNAIHDAWHELEAAESEKWNYFNHVHMRQFTINELQGRIEEYEARIVDLQTTISEQHEEVLKRDVILAARDKEIAALKAKLEADE